MEEPNIAIEIKTNEDLSPAQAGEIDAMLKEAFVDDVDMGYAWAQPTIHVSAWSVTDGRLVSHVGILEREMRVGEKPVVVGGISDVATVEDWRRKGLAARLMQAAEGFLRSEGKYQFAMLFCNPALEHYYAGLGYRPLTAPLYITSEGRRFRIDEIKMGMPLSGEDWPDGEIDLLGLPW